MIQRIQSLYLLAAVALMAVTLCTPLMWTASAGEQIRLSAFAIRVGGETIGTAPYYLPILLILACALPFITIFLFKRRMLQLRLCAAEAVLLIGCAVMEAMIYWGPLGSRGESSSLLPASFAPLAALFFVWLAARAIFRDELLVRSLDRIR